MLFLPIEPVDSRRKYPASINSNHIVNVLIYEEEYYEDYGLEEDKRFTVIFQILVGNSTNDIIATNYDTLENTTRKYEDYLDMLRRG